MHSYHTPKSATVIQRLASSNNCIKAITLIIFVLQEILERLIYPVVNQGFKLIEEEIVQNVEQIDTIL